MKTRGSRKVRAGKNSRRQQHSGFGVQLQRGVVPIKATNGNYWKACPKCGNQYLWDGGCIKGKPDTCCSGCGRPLIWSR